MKMVRSRMGMMMAVMLCLALLVGCGDDVVPPQTTGTATTVPTTAATTTPAETTAPAQTTVPAQTTEPAQTTVPAQTTEPAQTTVPTQTTAPVQTDPPATTAPAVQQEPADDDFVRVSDHIPGAVVALKYATEDNICGKVVYDFTDAYLRYGTVKKLAAVQRELESMGYSLKIWDAYRPSTAQFDLWEACKDPMFVTNPYRGFSVYCRGNTVGVTVVDSDGNELEMPTGFDVYSPVADRDYTDCSENAAKNAQFLQDIMEKHGFESHFVKWWQFMDSQDYDFEQEFLCN